MKKGLAWLILCLAFVFTSVLAIGCGSLSGDDSPQEQSEPSDSASEIEDDTATVSLTEKTLELYEGETYTLNYTTNSKTALTWSSSDPNIATVGSDGAVNAIRTGECNIFVSVGNKSDVCVLTVLKTVYSITVSSDAILLERGDTYNLLPSLRHNGQTVNGVNFEYEVSVQGVVNVDDGVISAIGAGETDITIFCNYNGVRTEKVVSVNVKEDVTVTVTPSSASIYFYDENGMVGSETLSVKVMDKGQVQSSPAIVWTSSNEKVVTVDENGEVTATGKGTALVKATYTKDGKEYSQAAQVVVALKEMAYDGQIILAKDGDYANVLGELNVSEIEKITIAQKTLEYSLDDGKIVISAEEAAKYKAGECSVIVTGEKYDYIIKGIVADSVISDKDEFAELLLSAKENAWGDKGFTGYYILDADINLENLELNTYKAATDETPESGINYCMLTNNKISAKGWQATLNGNGHTISNLNLGSKNFNGLFGEIGDQGVIENLAIKNVSMTGAGGIICYNNYGTIRNVYVEGKFFGSGYAGAGMPNAIFASIPRTGSKIENCIAVETSSKYYAGTALFGGLLRGDDTIVNSYGVSAFETPNVLNAVENETTTHTYSATKYSSISALFNALTEIEIESLPMLTIKDGTVYWGSSRIYGERENLNATVEINVENGSATIAELADKTVKSVTIGGSQTAFTQDSAAFSFTLSVPSGEYDIVFETAEKDYTAHCIVVKYINDAEDLKAMLADYKSHIIDVNGFGGYYKMTADIDLASETDGTKKAEFRSTYLVTNLDKKNNVAYAHIVGANRGWQGTFDGNGYAIKNLNLGAVTYLSLFATIGSSGVVKNLAIVSSSVLGNGAAYVAAFNYGTIENVYVEGSFSYIGVNANFPNGMIVGALEDGGTIKNCVVNYTGTAAYENSALAIGILNKANAENADITVENCFVISAAEMPVVGNSSQYAETIDVTEIDGLADIIDVEILEKNGDDIYWGNYKIN